MVEFAALFFAGGVRHSPHQQTKGEDTMKRLLLGGVLAFVPSLFVPSLFVSCLLVSCLLADTVHAQDSIKIGIAMAYSGQFADPTVQSDNGAKLYLKQHGDKLAGKNVEIIRKDIGGINPPVAKRLAQEL